MSPDNNLSRQVVFIQQFGRHYRETGSILPSSRHLGRAIAACIKSAGKPLRVLEVGSGTGSFTAEIIPRLQEGDVLDVVEMNPYMMAALQKRFQDDKRFKTCAEVRLFNQDVRTAPLSPGYDYIVFSLPLTNFPQALVVEILDLMLQLLNPGGIFAYVRYIFMGRIKLYLNTSSGRKAARAVQAALQDYARRYQIRRQAVILNLPPSWVFFWQKSPEKNGETHNE